MVKQYYEAKPSYRDLARKYDLNKNKINQWVKENSNNFKTTVDVAQELSPNWTGYLTVDGKLIRYRGHKGCVYIGVDNCGDIVHILAGDSHENKTSWARFFKELKLEINYALIVLVSDGNPDIMASCLISYENFVYSTCHYHFLKRVDRSFGYLTVIRNPEKRRRFKKELDLRQKIRWLLFQNTPTEFINVYEKIMRDFKQKKYGGHYSSFMIELLIENLKYLIPHYFDSNIPKTSNLVETTIKQYERRLKTIEGFQSIAGFKNYLNVFTMFLRFKKYTDCRGLNKYRNGQNRLQLAGINTDKIDWFSYGFKGNLLK